MTTASQTSSMAGQQENHDAVALKASTFKRLHPRAYLERFLSENYRPDGRVPSAFRETSVNVGSITTANGSALVRLGETAVVCGVKAEIAEPDLDRPEHGFLVPNLDLPALCSPRFKPGPPSDEAQVLSERLNEALVSAGTVSTKSLCIQPGKAVWVLYVDATCINYDGNVFDAALIAMVAALRNVRLPEASFNEDTGRTLCSRNSLSPLSLGKLPFPASFGIFDSNHLLADPSSFEEPLLDTTISVILDQDAQPISVTQHGPGLVSSDSLSQCSIAARARCQANYAQVYTL